MSNGLFLAICEVKCANCGDKLRGGPDVSKMHFYTRKVGSKFRPVCPSCADGLDKHGPNFKP